MNKVLRGSGCLIAAFLAIGTILALLFGAYCDPRRAAADARLIEVEQLRLLHQAMSRLENERLEGTRIELTGDSIPPEIRAFGAKAVRLDDIWPRIFLGGCVDNMAFLVFHGLRSGEKRIELLSGEVMGRELLWREQDVRDGESYDVSQRSGSE